MPVLPSRRVLRKLAGTDPNINDYAKATPMSLPAGTPSPVTELMRKSPNGR